MHIHPVFYLNQSAQCVRQALVTREVNRFYPPSGVVVDMYPTRSIKWTAAPNGEITGSVSYFRAKTFSAYRFYVRVSDYGPQSSIQIRVALKEWAIPLFISAYVIGLAICVVGVIFPLLGQMGIKRVIMRSFHGLEMVMKQWDQARSPHLLVATPPALNPEAAQDPRVPDVTSDDEFSQ